MKRLLTWLLCLILLIGLGIAVLAVWQDAQRFWAGGGPNPLLTPCPYGALAFIVAYIWSLRLAVHPFPVRETGQRNLNWLLVGATLFAWSNFTPILWRFYHSAPGTATGCSAQIITSPFRTACFGGATSFLLALIVGLWIWSLAHEMAGSKK